MDHCKPKLWMLKKGIWVCKPEIQMVSLKTPKMYRWNIWFAPCWLRMINWAIWKQTINVPWHIGKNIPHSPRTNTNATWKPLQELSLVVHLASPLAFQVMVGVIQWHMFIWFPELGKSNKHVFVDMQRGALANQSNCKIASCIVIMKLTAPILFMTRCNIPPTFTNLNCPSTYCLEVRATTNLKGNYELIVLSGGKRLSKKTYNILVTARDAFKHYFVQVTFQTLIPSLPVGNRYILMFFSWWPRCFTFVWPSWYPPDVGR